MFLRYRRLQAGRRARRRPADLARCSTGSASSREFRGGLRVTTARGDGRRPDGAHRPGAARARRADQPARAARGRAVRRGRRPVHRRARPTRSSTARRSTSAWSARSSTCAPRRCSTSSRPAGSRSISTVAPDADGQVHNVNADTAAAALAVALGAEKLLVLTDVEGLYRDWPDSDDVIGEISPEALAELMPTLASGMVPKMAACLDAVSGGRPAGHRRRRPGAARRAARDLHRRGRRHPGAARRRDQDPHRALPADAQGADMSDRRSERYAGAVMNTFGPPKLVLVRGEGAHVWDADGKALPRPARRHRRQRARPRPPGARRGVTDQLATLGHVSNFFATEPQVELAERLLALLGHDAGRVFFTNSGTEANEAAFKLTRRTGRTHLVAAEGGFHGRTMGALALTSKAGLPRAVRAAARRRHLRAVRRRRRARGRRRRRDRRGRPRADPGRGRRRRRRPPATSRAAREITTRARRAAVARRGADRHRPHRRLVRPPPTAASTPRRRHAGQGPRRRHPDRRLHRPSATPATLLEPGNHGTTFGGNPVACGGRARRARHDRDARACSTTRPASGEQLARRPRATTRWSPRCAARAADRARARPPTASAAGRRRPRWTPASSSTPARPTGSGSRRRWCSPTTQADAFLAAWPAILDAAHDASDASTP